MPEMLTEAVPYWEAFTTLSNSRNSGMAIGGIPLSEILAYCELNYIIDFDERDFLARIITRVDAHFIKGQQDDTKRPSETTDKS